MSLNAETAEDPKRRNKRHSEPGKRKNGSRQLAVDGWQPPYRQNRNRKYKTKRSKVAHNANRPKIGDGSAIEMESNRPNRRLQIESHCRKCIDKPMCKWSRIERR